MVGMYGGDIEDCMNRGDIKGMTQIGGIAGNSDGINGDGSSNVIRCTNYGTIIYEENLETDRSVNAQGGIIGCNFIGSIIQSCTNFGEVRGSGIYTGGISGTNSELVINSVNNGKVTGEKVVGGVVGLLDKLGIVENCTNKGEYIGTSDIGGIVGKNNGNEDNVKNSKDEWKS